jgi:5-methylcytosine-specific restriction endonuclease McrA
MRAHYSLEFGALMIRIIRGDTGNFDHLRSWRPLNRKIVEQNRECAICHEEFTDYTDIVPDHKNPKGMGGAWREDHPDNIQATHWWCNEAKGSSRMDD